MKTHEQLAAIDPIHLGNVTGGKGEAEKARSVATKDLTIRPKGK